MLTFSENIINAGASGSGKVWPKTRSEKAVAPLTNIRTDCTITKTLKMPTSIRDLRFELD
jgi:hypothetical protein